MWIYVAAGLEVTGIERYYQAILKATTELRSAANNTPPENNANRVGVMEVNTTKHKVTETRVRTDDITSKHRCNSSIQNEIENKQGKPSLWPRVPTTRYECNQQRATGSECCLRETSLFAC